MNLAAVNHDNVIHEVMNGCKNLKIHYKGLHRKCKYNSDIFSSAENSASEDDDDNLNGKNLLNPFLHEYLC